MQKITYKVSFEITTDKQGQNPLNWIPDALDEQLENNETIENYAIELTEITTN